MTSINANLNTAAYLLNSRADEAAASNDAGKSKTTAEAVVTASPSGAYQLDLSAEAKKYLESLKSEKLPEPKEDKNYGFKLSEADLKRLDAIIEKYADLPYNQENFDKLQADLKAERLDTLNLAAKEMISTFSVVGSFLDAFKDDGPIIKAEQRLKTQADNSETFINQIAADWYFKTAQAV